MSSTFHDFQAEREVLQALVFPELAERLRERRHHLEPIDLRFGVETVSEDDEARKTLLVLTVCLNEVARSRPFVIALVGDRYGWVPPADRARRAAEESGLAGEISGRSITDLELDFGILQQAGSRPVGAFAYFRNLDASGVAEDLRSRYADADTSRVDELKQRLLARLGPDRCRTYQARWDPARGAVEGLEEFRRLVVEDLWGDLEEQTRGYELATETPEDAERATLDAFVHEATRDFTGREPLLAELLSLAAPGGVTSEPRAGVCVTGPSGSGKSSLAAELIRRLGDDTGVLLLQHAAGISAASVRVDRLLERWCRELAAHLGEDDPPFDGMDGDQLERSFARLLTRASAAGRVVVVIDALNEFERTTRARYLTWLPPVWPGNARLIATAIPGPESGAIAGRGMELRELDPLTAGEADRLVDAVYRRYRREANPEVKRAIAGRRAGDGRPASGTPLWLELACEEMNLLEPGDLARAARYPAAPAARDYLRRKLTVSRGLVAAEPENPRSAGYLATALERLGLLVLDAGEIAPAERDLREAAGWHDRVARLSGEDGPPAASLQILARLTLAKGELAEARRLAGELEQLRRRQAETAPEDVQAQLAWLTSLDQLGDAAQLEGDGAAALDACERALQGAERLAALVPDDVTILQALSNALLKHGDIYLRADEPHRARPCHERMLQIQSRLHDMLPDDVNTYRILGLAHERLGMLEDASRAERERQLETAVGIYADIAEQLPDSEQAVRTLALGHFATAQLLAGDPERGGEAIEHTRRAHQLLSGLRARGRQIDPEAGRLLSFLDGQFGGPARTHPAAAAGQAGPAAPGPDRAEPAEPAGAPPAPRVARADQPAFAELNGLGMLARQSLEAGDHETALRRANRSLELARQIDHPPSVVYAHEILGDVLARTGQAGEAIRHYEEAVSVARRSGDQRGVAHGLASIGVAHYAAGNEREAIAQLTSAAVLFESWQMWPDLARALAYLGTAYLALGDAARARDVYSRRLEAARKTQDAPVIAAAMANLSRLLYATGERQEAIELGAQACELLRSLGAPDAAKLCAEVTSWRGPAAR